MKKIFLLDGLCCANCASKIENEAGKLDGVNSASVNFITTKMTIEAEDEMFDTVIKKVKKIIRRHEPDVVMREI